MITGFAQIQPGLKDGQYMELVQLAKEDDHGVYLPTHPVVKDGKLVGYFSIGSPGHPVVMAWLSTKELKARESFHLINTVENHVALGGGKGICFPVPEKSPFHPMMKPMGYIYGGTYDFFVKELR
jgi:hypothetical protein